MGFEGLFLLFWVYFISRLQCHLSSSKAQPHESKSPIAATLLPYQNVRCLAVVGFVESRILFNFWGAFCLLLYHAQLSEIISNLSWSKVLYMNEELGDWSTPSICFKFYKHPIQKLFFGICNIFLSTDLSYNIQDNQLFNKLAVK